MRLDDGSDLVGVAAFESKEAHVKTPMTPTNGIIYENDGAL